MNLEYIILNERSQTHKAGLIHKYTNIQMHNTQIHKCITAFIYELSSLDIETDSRFEISKG